MDMVWLVKLKCQ